MTTTPYTGPKIAIKDIVTRTGVPITGEFVINVLKVTPVEKEKRSVFWSEAQYPVILDTLCNHLQACKGKADKAPKAAPKTKPVVAGAPNGAGFFGGAAAPAATTGSETSGGFFGAVTAAPAPAPSADTGFNFGVGGQAVSAEQQAAAPAPFSF